MSTRRLVVTYHSDCKQEHTLAKVWAPKDHCDHLDVEVYRLQIGTVGATDYRVARVPQTESLQLEFPPTDDTANAAIPVACACGKDYLLSTGNVYADVQTGTRRVAVPRIF